ncbi:MAG TPA: nitroreductase family protein [Acidimicrobiales bacterium]
MSDFFDVVLRQRACRDFSAEPVPDADIERMLEAATHAPSAENTQPWIFVVVRDDAARAALSDLTKRLWEGGGRDYAAAHNEPHLFNEVDHAVARGLGGAPVFVVVAADAEAGAHKATLGSSIFPAVQNLLLAANALGYGSALTTLTTYGGDELRTLLALPEHVIPMAIVPLGRPARPLGPPRRRPVAESTHRDRYGTAW